MVHPETVMSVQNYLRRLVEEGMPVSFGVVFGSHAKGMADELSDIDLVVVSRQFDGVVARTDINRLWRVAARVDSRIEPIPCGQRQWSEDTSSAIIEIARSEGMQVSL